MNSQSKEMLEWMYLSLTPKIKAMPRTVVCMDEPDTFSGKNECSRPSIQVGDILHVAREVKRFGLTWFTFEEKGPDNFFETFLFEPCDTIAQCQELLRVLDLEAYIMDGELRRVVFAWEDAA